MLFCKIKLVLNVIIHASLCGINNVPPWGISVPKLCFNELCIILKMKNNSSTYTIA